MGAIELMIVIWLKLDKYDIQVLLNLVSKLKLIKIKLNEINVDCNESWNWTIGFN